MIELKLFVSDIDYDAVIKAVSGGGMAAAAAAMAARALPDSAKEDFAVKYINNSAARLEAMLEEAASRQGIRLHVSGAQAAIAEQT